LLRPNDGLGAVESLRHVRDEDEDVEGEAEAVPDQPENEEDPGGRPDPMNEQAGCSHTHYREPDTCAPRDCAHHRRCVSLHLHDPKVDDECVEKEEEADDVANEAEAGDDQGARVQAQSKERFHFWETHSSLYVVQLYGLISDKLSLVSIHPIFLHASIQFTVECGGY